MDFKKYEDLVLDECISGNDDFDDFLNTEKSESIVFYNYKNQISPIECANELWSTFISKPVKFKEEQDV